MCDTNKWSDIFVLNNAEMLRICIVSFASVCPSVRPSLSLSLSLSLFSLSLTVCMCWEGGLGGGRGEGDGQELTGFK